MARISADLGFARDREKERRRQGEKEGDKQNDEMAIRRMDFSIFGSQEAR